MAESSIVKYLVHEHVKVVRKSSASSR